jgi:hypothetical protein
MAHYKSVHKDDLIDDDSRTLIKMGFSRGAAGASDSTSATVAGPCHIEPRITAHASGPSITQAIAFSPIIATLHVTAQRGLDLDGLQLCRMSRQQVDAIIKTNSEAKVIPSAEVIA